MKGAPGQWNPRLEKDMLPAGHQGAVFSSNALCPKMALRESTSQNVQACGPSPSILLYLPPVAKSIWALASSYIKSARCFYEATQLRNFSAK